MLATVPPGQKAKRRFLGPGLALWGTVCWMLSLVSVSGEPGILPAGATVSCAALLAWARPGGSRSLRTFALGGLQKCAASAGARQALLETISNDDGPMRRHALQSLRPYLGPSTTKALLELVERADISVNERLTVLRYLALSLSPDNGPSAEPVLVDSLRSGSRLRDAHMAARAASFALLALGRLGLEQDTPLLLQYTGHPDADVRVAAWEALTTVWKGRTTPMPARLIGMAQDALDSGRTGERLAAIGLLRALRSGATDEILVARGISLKRPNGERRWGLAVRRTFLFQSPSLQSGLTAIVGPGALVHEVSRRAAKSPGVGGQWVLVGISGGRSGWTQREDLDFSGPAESSLDTRAPKTN